MSVLPNQVLICTRKYFLLVPLITQHISLVDYANVAEYIEYNFFLKKTDYYLKNNVISLKIVSSKACKISL